jgi:pimeloyl-ACP methyl ester carboxylesterase
LIRYEAPLEVRAVLLLVTGQTNAMQYKGAPARNWGRKLKGYAFGWAWFDPVSSWALRRLFVPSSLLWAAAEVAGTSTDRFYEAAHLPKGSVSEKKLADALSQAAHACRKAEAKEAEWQHVFFGSGSLDNDARRALESERYAASHAYNLSRRHFGFMLRSDPPKIRSITQSPDEVAAIYGANFEKLNFDFASAGTTEIEVSKKMERAAGVDYWLRFQSPSQLLGDTVYARVLEPHGVVNPPTIIFGHGICIEFDHWRGLIDEARTLRAEGFRVIRPVAPWHGRRRPRGSFGGEPIMARIPGGLFDAFSGAAQEWAVFANWARRTSSGPLAYGGTSLGALIAQFAAEKIGAANEALRPDGLFLITHSGRMTDATFQGDMANLLGVSLDAEANGWSRERIEQGLGLLDPGLLPAVKPEKIVTVLGKRDRITPYASGLSLIDSWGVPDENRFVWDRGHFSMPLTMIRNPAPVARFREVMTQL